MNMDYLYNLAFTCLNYVLDFTLYYKVSVQESQYFKNFYQYLYPPNQVVNVKLYTKDDKVDITDEFSKIIYKNSNIDWKDILIESLNNINLDENSHLDIKYTIENDQYRVIYHYGKDIVFPPYKQDDIEKYNQNNSYKKQILFAEIGDKDITQVIKEYAGPLNNFYQDHDHINIHACLVKDDNGEYLLVEDENIKITDSHVNELEFNKEDQLVLK